MNAILLGMLAEERRFMQVVLGPRQVGKTTSTRQVIAALGVPSHYATADTATLQSPAWIEEQWSLARHIASETAGPVVLAIDEVQKIADWSAWVKRLWDEDSFAQRDIRVVITGSSPLLVQRGLTESLAGRFETIPATHWSWPECRDAFGWDLDTFIFYGGYPGAAPLVADPVRWRAYVLDSIVETTVSRDVVLMTRVDKPALLRRVFNLACEHAGQELSYAKMVGQLQDAGNTTTVAHYLELLAGAGLVGGLQKYSAEAVRRRRSSPKLVVYTTALATAITGRSFEDTRSDGEVWGRLVEAAVGAHLLARARTRRGDVFYWRERVAGTDLEVDYVTVHDGQITGIEVKSGQSTGSLAGLDAFRRAYDGQVHTLVVGTGGMKLEEFLAQE
jgi:uncharacterized protein